MHISSVDQMSGTCERCVILVALISPINPIGNSLKNQKQCIEVQRLVFKPPFKIP